jgi:hypothetical protein
MITFEGDERFADVEYVGMTYESAERVLESGPINLLERRLLA